MIADSFDLELVKEKDAEGRVVRPVETWGGGGKFTMCPQRAYEKFAVRDAARLSALGFAELLPVEKEPVSLARKLIVEVGCGMPEKLFLALHTVSEHLKEC